MMRLLLILTTMSLLSTLSLVDTYAKKKELGKVRKVVRGFSAIDTNYIEPQHYNFTVMLQSTFNYDIYWLKGDKQTVLFTPDVPMKIGPYVGWRWLFLGYTFDLKNVNLSDKQKREIALSIYSSQIGVDLFYRRTGSDYKIRKVDINGVDTQSLRDVPFDGINVGITGINLYYIFNHKRFSYPAAFSQSTCQKRSCGSWMTGIGYTRNTISLDYDKLKTAIETHIPSGEAKLDSSLMFNSVNFTDVNFSCGYAYNWVFAKDWLFCASASAALAYKHTKSDDRDGDAKHGFQLDNVNIDGIGRFGLVYNNMRWYSGLSAIVHAYTYRKSRFAANNVFGSINVYIGYNFGLKGRYKKR